ncbi:MAG: UDP-N-acetylmuramoyl-tripeptide--D-alanyl-D-alanine ligase [Geminicoccaceae bacterium]
MIALWTAAEAARALSLAPKGDWSATGISIDSRTTAPGDLFIAIKGPNNDGHDYVPAALDAGAVAAMVAHLPDGVAPERLLVVTDTQAGLEALGAAGRARSSARILGLTGSVGKTSTKMALARGLKAQAPPHASAESLNNHWGVPLSLARMPRDEAYGVFEMGMNHAGEISRLTRQVRPHVALITAIAPAHIEFFESEEAIADAKAEIFEAVEPDGFAILDRSSTHYQRLADHAQAAGVSRIVTFGRHDEADIRLESEQVTANGTDIIVQTENGPLNVRIGAPGTHWVDNSLAMIAAVGALGGDVEAFAASLAGLEASAGRGRQHRLTFDGRTITLIDDSYNANPRSMAAAIALLAQAPGRKIAALGSMLELGRESDRLHAELAGPLNDAGVASVITVGAAIAPLAAALPADRLLAELDDAGGAYEILRQKLRDGDTLLVKGSKASGMGRLVDALIAADAGRAH